MKIRTDFDELWRSVHTMGASARDFSFSAVNEEELAIDAKLERGIEIDLKSLDTTHGLLSYQGRQVLLYIPDQGSRITEVLESPEKGRKFHVAECSTLEAMRSKGRFERYVVTNDMSGVFDVSGIDPLSGYREGKAALCVCKNCLKILNYQGYQQGGRGKGAIFKDFTLERFFKTYSTRFRSLPNRFTDRGGSYSEDWQQQSRQFRAGRNWTCESCRVNLADERRLLHSHHVDGNKRNNESSNLKALCADCHRKQPMHGSMMIKGDDMSTIQRLRRQQNLLAESGSWDEVLELIDSAYEGVALKLRREGRPAPEVAVDIMDGDKGIILTPELSWPAKKRAVVDTEAQVQMLAGAGWQAELVTDVLQQ